MHPSSHPSRRALIRGAGLAVGAGALAQASPVAAQGAPDTIWSAEYWARKGEVRLFIDNPEGGSEKLLIGVPFADIGEAKLVLTDALIEAAKARRPSRAMADGSEWTENDETDEQTTDLDDRRQ